MTKQFDLPAFKAFVAGKDPDERYTAFNAGCCALAQFGFRGVSGFRLDEIGIPEQVYIATVHQGEPTFGALLSRLNNLPADPPTAAEGGDDSPVSALTPLDGERA